MEQLLSIIPLTLAFFVPYFFNFYHYPTIPYYTKFLQFATGKINKEQYFNTFGNQVNRNYRLAEFMSTSSLRSDSLFVWEDGSALYALSRNLPTIKFVAGYHVKDFSSKTELVSNFEHNPPGTIILFPESEPFVELSKLLNEKYMQISLFNDAYVFRLKKTNK